MSAAPIPILCMEWMHSSGLLLPPCLYTMYMCIPNGSKSNRPRIRVFFSRIISSIRVFLHGYPLPHTKSMSVLVAILDSTVSFSTTTTVSQVQRTSATSDISGMSMAPLEAMWMVLPFLFTNRRVPTNTPLSVFLIPRLALDTPRSATAFLTSLRTEDCVWNTFTSM